MFLCSKGVLVLGEVVRLPELSHLYEVSYIAMLEIVSCLEG